MSLWSAAEQPETSLAVLHTDRRPPPSLRNHQRGAGPLSAPPPPRSDGRQAEQPVGRRLIRHQQKPALAKRHDKRATRYQAMVSAPATAAAP